MVAVKAFAAGGWWVGLSVASLLMADETRIMWIVDRGGPPAAGALDTELAGLARRVTGTPGVR